MVLLLAFDLLNNNIKRPLNMSEVASAADEFEKKWNNADYINWQKCNQLLWSLKEDLDKFVQTNAKSFHDHITDELSREAGTTHVGCCKLKQHKFIKNAAGWSVSCRTLTCTKWIEKIARHHEHRENIYWSNSPVISVWPESYIEVAKLYMGKLPIRRSSISDPEPLHVVQLLHFMSNCIYIRNSAIRNTGISKRTICFIRELISKGNELMHSSHLSCGDSDVSDMKALVSQVAKGLRFYNAELERQFEMVLNHDTILIRRDEYRELQGIQAILARRMLDLERTEFFNIEDLTHEERGQQEYGIEDTRTASVETLLPINSHVNDFSKFLDSPELELSLVQKQRLKLFFDAKARHIYLQGKTEQLSNVASVTLENSSPVESTKNSSTTHTDDDSTDI